MKDKRLLKLIGLTSLILVLLVGLSFAVSGCSSSGQKEDEKLSYGSGNKAKDEVDGEVSELAGKDAYDTGKINNNSSVAEEVEGKSNSSQKQNENSSVSPMDNNNATLSKQYAVIETNKGKIVFELFPEKAPNTVANFVKLANSGFYNGIKWHRVIPGFVIQGGDPLSKDNDPSNDGRGGPGYTIKAEFNDMKHETGTVAMARSEDPDSAGSQFYICLAPQPHLDGQYTVFGKVVEGMDVVNKIQQGDMMQKVYIQNK